MAISSSLCSLDRRRFHGSSAGGHLLAPAAPSFPPASSSVILRSGSHLSSSRSVVSLLCGLFWAVLLHIPVVTSVVVPSSSCYVIDNSSRLVDFTDWIGHPFEYDGKESDLVVRFCKDVESRSQAGYIDFGHYETSNYFVAGSGNVDFVQRFYNGDLANCEHSYDKMGRTAQVDVLCGDCLTGTCKGALGCICNVAYDQTKCRITIELAIPCVKQGPRVFNGFTLGFHPRSSEVVYNGMTQLGFDKLHRDFSFGTEQTHVSLYLTAISTLSGLVGKPSLQVNPDKGLDVELSGSAKSGKAPTTLSPTILSVNWRCLVARDTPYEINITIPIEGYDPVEFILTKLCEYRQDREDDATRGWATFGVISCIFIVLSTIFCCGGFIYKTRIEHQHGLDALPGMTILSACLEAVSGLISGPRGYQLGEDIDGTSSNQASWERTPASTQATQRTSERTYGSI